MATIIELVLEIDINKERVFIEKLSSGGEENMLAVMRMMERENNKIMRKGVITGRREGRKEGRKEGAKMAKIEMAKEMLAENIDMKKIARITKLSETEIDKLKAK